MDDITKKKLTKWTVGLVSAGLTGVATTATTAAVAPKEINFDEGFYKLLLVLAVGFIGGVFNHLQKSPLDKALYDE